MKMNNYNKNKVVISIKVLFLMMCITCDIYGMSTVPRLQRPMSRMDLSKRSSAILNYKKNKIRSELKENQVYIYEINNIEHGQIFSQDDVDWSEAIRSALADTADPLIGLSDIETFKKIVEIINKCKNNIKITDSSLEELVKVYIYADKLLIKIDLNKCLFGLLADKVNSIMSELRKLGDEIRLFSEPKDYEPRDILTFDAESYREKIETLLDKVAFIKQSKLPASFFQESMKNIKEELNDAALYPKLHLKSATRRQEEAKKSFWQRWFSY